MIPSIIDGSLMRATPPALRMSAGTRSRAITATAPASSATLACSGVTTSMMTPPLSIWARPFLVAQVDVSTVMWNEFLWWLRSVRRPGLAPGSSPVRVGRAPRAGRLSHERPRGLPGVFVRQSACHGTDHAGHQAGRPSRRGRRQARQRLDEIDDVLIRQRAEQVEQPKDRRIRDPPEQAERPLQLAR